jgi:hypothetical protein
MLIEHVGDQISAVSGPAIEQSSLLDCNTLPESGVEWDFMTVDKELRVVHLCGPRFVAMADQTKLESTECAYNIKDVMPAGISNLLCPLIEVCLEHATGVQQLHTLYCGQQLTLFAYPMLSTDKTAVGVQLIYRPTTRNDADVRNLLVTPAKR